MLKSLAYIVIPNWKSANMINPATEARTQATNTSGMERASALRRLSALYAAWRFGDMV